MIDAPYCFLGFTQCRGILESFGYRVRERGYVDEVVPNALLTVFDPTLPIGKDKIAIHKLEDIELLAQEASRRFFRETK